MNGWMCGEVGGEVSGWVDGWMGRWIYSILPPMCHLAKGTVSYVRITLSFTGCEGGGRGGGGDREEGGRNQMLWLRPEVLGL